MKQDKVTGMGVLNNSPLAFTLAEVLITLAIIGVVAALTIPAVVQKYQKTQAVTQLKKTYVALASTTNLAIANEGPVSGWEIENNNGADFANKYLIPYLKISKNCGTDTGDTCSFSYTTLNGNTQNALNSAWARFYLNDGSFIAAGAFQTSDTYKYAYVYVDINGQKKPNKFGKDVFKFVYWIKAEYAPEVAGKFIAYGANWSRDDIVSDRAEYTCKRDKRGELCAALIMKDSWQMLDDYPW